MFSIGPVAFAAPGASMICRAPHHAGNSETRLSAPNACHACGHDAAPPISSIGGSGSAVSNSPAPAPPKYSAIASAFFEESEANKVAAIAMPYWNRRAGPI